MDGSTRDDSIGQLRSATGKESGGGTTRLHEKFGYGYDAGGNLQYRTNNALVQTFGVDNLNQLTTVSRNTSNTVAGMTSGANTSATVNSLAASRYSDNTFAKEGFSLVDGTNTFTAIAQDSLGRSATNAVSVWMPLSATFQYDANGNLLSDGRRGFEYDAENQLTRVTVTNAWRTEFGYDGRLRRRIRREFNWNGSAYVLTGEVRYVYDGMRVIQERDGNNVPRVAYTRGLDLSGTFEGAGGIGGLLARHDLTQGIPAPAYYHADGNGNVTTLFNAQQHVVARYQYDPYGQLLGQAGPLSEANLYRFSSKEHHANSGLYYYGYRLYEPSLQRWINRDPLEEEGGINLYQFGLNSPVGVVDLWGLAVSGQATLVLQPTLLLTPEQIAARAAAQALAAAAAAELARIRADCAPPEQKPRCPDDVRAALSKAVDEACATAFACEEGDTPQTINGKVRQIQRCLRARHLRENTCWNGGDEGHIRQMENLLNRIKNCKKKLAKL